MRCTTSTPSAITSPLPVGRSGLRSMLLRSRKSSSRGSAGRRRRSTLPPVPLTRFRRRSPTSGRRPSAASCAARRRVRPAAAAATPGWRGARPRSARRPAGDTDTSTWRPSSGCAMRVNEAQLGQRGDHPRHRRRTHPFAHGERARGHRALLGQRRQRRQLRQRHRGVRTSEAQLAGQPDDRQATRSLARRASASFTRQRVPIAGLNENGACNAVRLLQSIDADEPPGPCLPRRCSSRGRSSS